MSMSVRSRYAAQTIRPSDRDIWFVKAFECKVDKQSDTTTLDDLNIQYICDHL